MATIEYADRVVVAMSAILFRKSGLVNIYLIRLSIKLSKQSQTSVYVSHYGQCGVCSIFSIVGPITDAEPVESVPRTARKSQSRHVDPLQCHKMAGQNDRSPVIQCDKLS